MIVGIIRRMSRKRPQDPHMYVSRNIEAAMEVRGMSAAELARSAGINPSGVYDILTGRSRSPRLDTISKIAAALGVSVADLLDGQTDPDLRRDLHRAISRLPEEDQRRILATALAWADKQ